MQYGGWYDNPQTGRNQRWWNGVWTDGEEPGKQSSNNQSSGSGNATFDTLNSQTAKLTNEYVDKLIAQAQGDYDFAAKYLEAQYKLALGSDDKKTQEFLKTVANSLEEKVGRIVYDNQTQTYRHEQDVNLLKNRTVGDKDLALKRLFEDEQTLKEEAEKANQMAREEQGSALNQRGILSSTRENATGLAGKEVGRLEEDIRGRMSALERAGQRSEDDINLTANQKLEDIGIADQRGRDDLITGVRRGIQDTQLNNNQATEEAKRRLERLKAQYEGERRSQLTGAASLSGLYAKS